MLLRDLNHIVQLEMIMILLWLKINKLFILSLLELRLRCCGLTDGSILSLCLALKKNPPLRQLDLSCNRIGDEGAKALSKALRVNNNLMVLSLANNIIGDIGAAFLVQVS